MGTRLGSLESRPSWAARRPHRPRPQSSRRSKLEKADILELTVRHLQSLRRVQVTGEARAAARAQGPGLRPRAPTACPCHPRSCPPLGPRHPGQVSRRLP